MSNGNNKIQNYGYILKEEKKKHGLTNRGFADLVGYTSDSGDKMVSMIFSGKRNLSDYGFKRLSETWNICEDYLRGLSKYRTVDDIREAQNQLEFDGFNRTYSNVKEYLNFFNVDVEIDDNAELHIIKKDGKQIMNARIDFSELVHFVNGALKINQDMIDMLFSNMSARNLLKTDNP